MLPQRNGSFGVRNEEECFFHHLSGFTSTLCQIISPVLFSEHRSGQRFVVNRKPEKSKVLQKINISLCMNMALAGFFSLSCVLI